MYSKTLRALVRWDLLHCCFPQIAYQSDSVVASELRLMKFRFLESPLFSACVSVARKTMLPAGVLNLQAKVSKIHKASRHRVLGYCISS